MRKYNIPLKDVKEVKQEIVECSSGGGEGVKEYYYKIKPYLEDYEALPTVLNLFIPGCSYIIQVGDKTVDLNNYCGFAISNGAVNRNLIAVKFKDIVTIGMHPEGGAELILPKGNLYNRTEYFFRLIGENAEEAVSVIQLYTQEITKEEYESMITYKPE